MTAMRCCLCGRALAAAAVLIGALPVGPTCARKAGLVPLARRNAGSVRLFNGPPAGRRADPRTLDMFEEAANA